jgi:hypothetical protein
MNRRQPRDKEERHFPTEFLGEIQANRHTQRCRHSKGCHDHSHARSATWRRNDVAQDGHNRRTGYAAERSANGASDEQLRCIL